MRYDVHQHLWPDALVDGLRRRRDPPYLDGWTLVLAGEPPYAVRPTDHDPAARAAQARADGADRVLLSLSSPLGLEHLPADQAAPLLEAWNDAGAELSGPFAAWAAAGLSEAEPARLAKDLARGLVGLQLPATALAQPADLAALGPLLAVLEDADKPLLVHPGPSAAPPGVPGWWPALVPYVAQQQAAWHSWHIAGRSQHPRLRVCFVALAGLAPLHHERLVARGGPAHRVDPGVFLETSSYGTTAIDAVLRVVGVDAVVHGSDRPYAAPGEPGLGAALTHAVRVANPRRLLDGDSEGSCS